MSCEQPKVIWLRSWYPINCTEEEKTRLNKPKMKYQKGYYPVEVPCGTCTGCRLDHANEWATRCYCEQKQWDTGCFITLTYNNSHLPLSKSGKMTLRKRDIQLFFKNLRKNEHGDRMWQNPITGKFENPIRYMGCGEYGPRGGRPHYHIIIFNWKPKDLKYYKQNEHGDRIYTSKTLQKYWEDKQQKVEDKYKTRGLVVVGELNYKTACYTARYCQKKAGLEPQKRKIYFEEEINKKTGEITLKRKFKKIKTEVEPEFILCSRCPGIGRQYWDENTEKIKENNGIWLNVDTAKLKQIPRFFKKQWEKEDWEEYENWKYQQQIKGLERQDEVINKLNLPDKTNYEKIKFIRQTTAEALKEKANILKRKDL